MQLPLESGSGMELRAVVPTGDSSVHHHPAGYLAMSEDISVTIAEKVLLVSSLFAEARDNC